MNTYKLRWVVSGSLADSVTADSYEDAKAYFESEHGKGIFASCYIETQ